MENNKLNEYENSSFENENNEVEHTPKLFSEENNLESDDKINNETEQLFDQDIDEEEDFEIPAFLRKQKF